MDELNIPAMHARESNMGAHQPAQKLDLFFRARATKSIYLRNSL
jgi:hypothetical protein